MSIIVLVAEFPDGSGGVQRLEEFATKLGKLPDGVQQLEKNVWLADPELAPDFLLRAGRIAGQDPKIRAYSTAPKPPSG